MTALFSLIPLVRAYHGSDAVTPRNFLNCLPDPQVVGAAPEGVQLDVHSQEAGHKEFRQGGLMIVLLMRYTDREPSTSERHERDLPLTSREILDVESVAQQLVKMLVDYPPVAYVLSSPHRAAIETACHMLDIEGPPTGERDLHSGPSTSLGRIWTGQTRQPGARRHRLY